MHPNFKQEMDLFVIGRVLSISLAIAIAHNKNQTYKFANKVNNKPKTVSGYNQHYSDFSNASDHEVQRTHGCFQL